MYVTNGEIVEMIYKSGNYKALCKSIAKKDLLAEELYSTFIVRLLEFEEGRLWEIKERGELEFFCVGVVNNIWGHRNRIKTYKVGSTSPLFEYSSTYEVRLKPNKDGNYSRVATDSCNDGWSELESGFFCDPVLTEPYDVTVDFVTQDAERIVKEEWDHPDKTTMYKARVFYYSYFQHKNPKQFSKISGIAYSTVIKTCNEWKEKLKKKLKIDD